MKKHLLLLATLSAVLLLGLLPAVAVAQDGPKFQICMAIDGSSSIAPADFTIMLEGIAAAIEDPTCVSHDGLMELTIVQFSDFAAIEVGPEVITAANAGGLAAQIRGIVQMTAATNMGDAFATCTDALLGSPYFADAEKRFINLSTDGVPTVGEPDPEEWAITARDNAIAAGIDEIDAEAIGPGADALWLRDNIVWPQPGTLAPPFTPGWVDTPETFREFADGLCDKFQLTSLEVKKGRVVRPADPDDLGLFNLLIDGTLYATNVGEGGTTGPQNVIPGTHTASETAGRGTNLDNYDTTYECTINDDPGPSGSGTSLSIRLTFGDNAVCTFTNGSEHVPEASTLILLASGLMGVAGYAGLRLRKK